MAPTPPRRRGSVWFDAEAEKAASLRPEAAFERDRGRLAGCADAAPRGRAAAPPPAVPPSAPPPAPPPVSPPARTPAPSSAAVGRLAAEPDPARRARAARPRRARQPRRARGRAARRRRRRQAARRCQPTTHRAPTGPDAGAGAWRELDAAPTARQQVATAVLDGRIWVVGGLVGTETATATTRVESYDPAINAWSTRDAAAAPAASRHRRRLPRRARRHRRLGAEGRGPHGQSRRARCSRCATGAGCACAPLRHPRAAAAAAAVVDDKIVVTGGQADSKLVEQTEILPAASVARRAADLPTPREHLAAVRRGRPLPLRRRRAQAVVGHEHARARALRPPRRPLDEARRTCRSRAAASARRSSRDGSSRSAARARRGVIKNVQSYDLKSGRWSQLDALPTPRHGLGLAAFGDTLYAIGGALGGGTWSRRTRSRRSRSGERRIGGRRDLAPRLRPVLPQGGVGRGAARRRLSSQSLRTSHRPRLDA